MSTDNNQTDGTDTGKPAGSERTFTQAELDAIVRDRLTREREKYAGYDDLKAKAEKWAEHEEAQKSELQKLSEATQKAQAERDQALQRANERMIQAQFIAEASRLGVAHPGDAYALADKSGVSIADDGAVVGVDQAVKALVDANRLPLSARPHAPDLNGGAGSGETNADRKPELTPEERAIAKRMGLTPEKYAAQKR